MPLDFNKPIAAVDLALFTIRDDALCLILARRQEAPFKNVLALPGGFIHTDEDQDAEAAARRVIRSKLGIDAPYVEQLYTFSGRSRDPRGWSISVVYYALVPEDAIENTKIKGITVMPVEQMPSLPFDHDKIAALAIDRIRGKASYSSLPAFLLPEHFTINSLHKMYENVLGAKLDKASFRRKVIDQGMIEPVAGEIGGGAHRPAQLYRKSQRMLQELKHTI